VRGDQHDPAVRADRFEVFGQRGGEMGVEAVERLVEQPDRCRPRVGDGVGRALALAGGEEPHRHLLQRGEAQTIALRRRPTVDGAPEI
jgi:hypothetical protein